MEGCCSKCVVVNLPTMIVTSGNSCETGSEGENRNIHRKAIHEPFFLEGFKNHDMPN